MDNAFVTLGILVLIQVKLGEMKLVVDKLFPSCALQGSQCADTVGSSDSGLIVGLAVGLPVGLGALCCFATMFVLFAFLYWRKGRKQELLLADEWSDDSSDGMGLDDISSYGYLAHITPWPRKR